MFPSESLDILEAAFRQAVAAERLAAAAALLDRYMAGVERAALAAPRDSEKLRQLAGRTELLLDWAAVMTLSSREGASAERRRLQSVRVYGPVAERTPGLRTDG